MTTQELTSEFLKNYAEKRLRASTIRGYKNNIDKYIVPELGGTDIKKINAGILDDLNESMPQLSNKSKIYIHATLRKILNYAIRRDYIDKNPYDQFDMPKIKKYGYSVLKEDEIIRLMKCSEGSDIEIPVKLATRYGLRRGECLGLMPEDLDIKNNVLHIQRTRSTENRQETVTPCKTEKSNRKILLRSEDTQLLAKKKSGYICDMTPNKLNYKFKKLLRENGFEKMRFHDLRHSFATIILTKNVNPKIVQAILGHSKINTTLDIYSHEDLSLQMNCIKAWENIDK